MPHITGSYALASSLHQPRSKQKINGQGCSHARMMVALCTGRWSRPPRGIRRYERTPGRVGSGRGWPGCGRYARGGGGAAGIAGLGCGFRRSRSAGIDGRGRCGVAGGPPSDAHPALTGGQSGKGASPQPGRSAARRGRLHGGRLAPRLAARRGDRGQVPGRARGAQPGLAGSPGASCTEQPATG